MINKLKETVHDIDAETLFSNTSGLNKPKNFVLTHNRYKTFWF